MSLYMLAGTNGAGKSSIGGTMIRAAGGDYFNPDEAARQIAEANPGASIAEANSAAWLEGKRLLERAIAERGNFAFETTLGGRTLTRLLADAIEDGIDVHMWYVALASPELHLARVRARVSRGGHDIPEHQVRRRYDASRHNLLELLHGLASLRVYDNSADADPAAGTAPAPELILHMERGRILHHCELATAPEWGKPILLTALEEPPAR
ncbi:MAG TPA: zeta toxin family protein [Kofleriaceae bacterium]|jgi:predicted ABC-type ATPase|nr:zeta toxin family protein [Kofleriaceae bacterium]